MDPTLIPASEWNSGYDTPRPSYVPRTSLTDARDVLLTHPNTRARAEAGQLSTQESIYYAQCLLEPLPRHGTNPGAGRKQPVRNSFQWAGSIERHIQAIAVRRLRRIQAILRVYWADMNLDRKRLAQTIISARRSQLMIRRDRDIAAGRVGPDYSIQYESDLIWEELLRQGVWVPSK